MINGARIVGRLSISSERVATFELFPFPTGLSNSLMNGLLRRELRTANCSDACAAQEPYGAMV